MESEEREGEAPVVVAPKFSQEEKLCMGVWNMLRNSGMRRNGVARKLVGGGMVGLRSWQGSGRGREG